MSGADPETAASDDPGQALRGSAKPADQFAWLRTSVALQRTLLASVRTSVSLIGFGFTVAQFFEKLRVNLDEGTRVLGPELPRNLGLVLILVGVLSLALSSWQYSRAMHVLRSGSYAVMAMGAGKSMHNATYMVSYAVLLIGIVAFISVFARF